MKKLTRLLRGLHETTRIKIITINRKHENTLNHVNPETTIIEILRTVERIVHIAEILKQGLIHQEIRMRPDVILRPPQGRKEPEVQALPKRGHEAPIILHLAEAEINLPAEVIINGTAVLPLLTLLPVQEEVAILVGQIVHHPQRVEDKKQ